MKNNPFKKIISLFLPILAGVLLLNSPVHAAKTVTYYHHDALGSPVAMTDESGNLKCNEDYMPYGERIRKEAGCEDNNIWYTGKPEEPDLGLQYFGARWYDPSIGRFTGIDPIKFQEGNVHSFNAYAYANNNPYKYIDPDGRENDIVTGFHDNVDDAVEYLWSEGNPRMDFLEFEGEGIVTPVGGVTSLSLKSALNIKLLRNAYKKEVKSLKDIGNNLKAAGADKESIARTLHRLRRDLGKKFKDITPKEELEKIHKANLRDYGDKLGPSIEHLRKKGKTWDDIIESSARPGDLSRIKE